MYFAKKHFTDKKGLNLSLTPIYKAESHEIVISVNQKWSNIDNFV